MVGSTGAAGASQRYPGEDYAGQPHRYGNDCAGAPGAGAEITSEHVQMQHSVGYDDQPHHHGHHGPVSPIVADMTGGAGQSLPSEDHADQPHHRVYRRPESPGCYSISDITAGHLSKGNSRHK